MVTITSGTLLTALVSLFAFARLGNCWGTLGHRTVAYLAEKYFEDGTAAYVNGLLAGEDISEAALWADKIKHTPIGAGTSEWHYIDAKDDPPRVCAVQYKRDCSGKVGCVVSAIKNMTARANDADLPPGQNGAALKFLLHFIGDVHQPLHTENEARGGNEIPVLWNKRHTNLHSVWDTDIPDKMNGGNPKDERAQAMEWADALYELQVTGSCTDVTEAEKCALEWAGDANTFICSYVLKDDVEGVINRNLATDYYDGAAPVVQELIAKAGFRLGAWLNGLAAANKAFNGQPVEQKPLSS